MPRRQSARIQQQQKKRRRRREEKSSDELLPPPPPPPQPPAVTSSSNRRRKRRITSLETIDLTTSDNEEEEQQQQQQPNVRRRSVVAPPTPPNESTTTTTTTTIIFGPNQSRNRRRNGVAPMFFRVRDSSDRDHDHHHHHHHHHNDMPPFGDGHLFRMMIPASSNPSQMPGPHELMSFFDHILRALHEPEGLTEEQRNLLPVCEVNETQKIQICVICLAKMIPGEQIKRLPCLHSFHVACIDEWISQSSKCPIDMLEIF